MTSRVITFRLDTESIPGQIFEKWERQGYESRQIVEAALTLAEDIEPTPLYDMNDTVLSELRNLVDRLERVAEAIQKGGGTVTGKQQQVIDDAINPKFLESMKKIVRPGFAVRPTGDDEA